MATPVDRLKALANVKAFLTAHRAHFSFGAGNLVASLDPTFRTQAANLLQPIDDAFAAALAQVTIMQNNVTVTNADKVAFADAEIATAKAP